MDWLTLNNVTGALLVLVGSCTVINLVGATVDRLRKWRRPQADMAERLTGVDAKLATDKRRLDSQEARLEEQHTGLMVICAGVQALLEHELHNGNADDMKQASADIAGWLRQR